MRKLHINSVKPGDKLARAILQENGNILLGVGVELNERFITRLTTLGIDMLFIDDPMTEDLEPTSAIHDNTRKKATETVFKTMSTLVDQPISERQNHCSRNGPILPESVWGYYAGPDDTRGRNGKSNEHSGSRRLSVPTFCECRDISRYYGACEGL